MRADAERAHEKGPRVNSWPFAFANKTPEMNLLPLQIRHQIGQVLRGQAHLLGGQH